MSFLNEEEAYGQPLNTLKRFLRKREIIFVHGFIFETSFPTIYFLFSRRPIEGLFAYRTTRKTLKAPPKK